MRCTGSQAMSVIHLVWALIFARAIPLKGSQRMRRPFLSAEAKRRPSGDQAGQRTWFFFKSKIVEHGTCAKASKSFMNEHMLVLVDSEAGDAETPEGEEEGGEEAPAEEECDEEEEEEEEEE